MPRDAGRDGDDGGQRSECGGTNSRDSSCCASPNETAAGSSGSAPAHRPHRPLSAGPVHMQREPCPPSLMHTIVPDMNNSLWTDAPRRRGASAEAWTGPVANVRCFALLTGPTGGRSAFALSCFFACNA